MRSREVPEAGINGYIAKPVKIEDLQIALRILAAFSKAQEIDGINCIGYAWSEICGKATIRLGVFNANSIIYS